MAAAVDIRTRSKVVRATPATSASPDYSTGDNVGGLLTFTDALDKSQTGVLMSVTISDKAGQTGALDLVLFDSNPSSTTFTDNGALTVNDADLVKILGVVAVVSADYHAFADNSVASVAGVGLPLQLAGASDQTGQQIPALYGALVARGTINLASTSDLQVSLGILWD